MHEFFTDLSIELNNKYDNLKCSGIAFGRNKCFKKFEYSNLGYISDIKIRNKENFIDFKFLHNIENKYQFSISECIHAERHFEKLHKDEKLFMAQEIIRKTLSLLEIEKPDLVILEGIDDFTSLFLYYYCKNTDINFFYFVYARLGSYLIKSNRLDTGPLDFQLKLSHYEGHSLKESKILQGTKSFVKEYVLNKSQPSYVSDKSMLFKRFSIADLQILKSVFLSFAFDSDTFGSLSPSNVLTNRFIRIKREAQYKRFFYNKFISLNNLNNDFLVYPLHFHPEAATLIQGRFFNNQIEIIEMISKALPSNIKLIVKEHVVSIGRRGIEFYKKIENFHNVFFISERVDVYQLLEKSRGVCTISSSMGLEALMLGKPVLVFGEIFYQLSKNVIQVGDLRKIPEYIKTMIELKFDEDDFLKLLAAFKQDLIEVSPGFSAHKYDMISLKSIANSI
jgi:hypothetical protein